MAVSAGVADLGKNQLGMALSAGGQRLVHAKQRVAGLVVIEIRQGTNWLPTHAGVTCLTGHIEIAVRTSGGGLIHRLAGQQKRRPNHEPQDNNRTFPGWLRKTTNFPCIYPQITQSCGDRRRLAFCG